MDRPSEPSESRWRRYYDAAGEDPRPTLQAALTAWGDAPPGQAIDLGCGSGRDAVPLLLAGWRVLGIDGETEALTRLDARLDAAARARLTPLHARFETLEKLPPADLINASMSLPFCAPEAFPALWANIRAALRPGGLFAGHLLGPNDSWAARGVAVHDRTTVETMLAWLEVLRCTESERDGTTATGTAKHWHIFEIAARAPAVR